MNQVILAVLLTFPFVVSCSRDEQRQVADCREAGLRAAAKYKGEGFLNRDIHYNRKTHGCYLSLNYLTKDVDAPAASIWNLEVQDVNENRMLILCKTPDHADTACFDFRSGEMKPLAYTEYTKLRQEYMEQKQKSRL